MKQLFPITLLFILLFSAGCRPAGSSQKQPPLIGISCSHSSGYSSTRMTYTESVIRAGGTPMLIPITTDSAVLADMVDRLDGIILIGGDDIHPSYYNEAPIEQLGEVDSLRDVYDITLIRLAARRRVPMLGICRGEQLINVAFGGSLYQDIPSQYPDTTINHNQKAPNSVPTHRVSLLPGSVMEQITGRTEVYTNSHHHQAVKHVAPGFRITAWTADSIPEAIECTTGLPIWGVQFHPETLTVAGDSIAARFFHFLINKAADFR